MVNRVFLVSASLFAAFRGLADGRGQEPGLHGAGDAVRMRRDRRGGALRLAQACYLLLMFSIYQ